MLLLSTIGYAKLPQILRFKVLEHISLLFEVAKLENMQHLTYNSLIGRIQVELDVFLSNIFGDPYVQGDY